jgi:hypothetical protein
VTGRDAATAADLACPLCDVPLGDGPFCPGCEADVGPLLRVHRHARRLERAALGLLLDDPEAALRRATEACGLAGTPASRRLRVVAGMLAQASRRPGPPSLPSEPSPRQPSRWRRFLGRFGR